jgi:3-dehydroquinate synthase
MDSILQEFQVTFRYPVHFTSGVFEPGNPVLPEVVGRDSRVAFVVDRGLLKERRNLPARIQAVWPDSKVLVLPGGERVKNHQIHLKKVLRTIHQAGLCRHSYLVAVGGGAVLDVAGYAAATAHRGIRLVRVPTTVLAQADSGVGVKNGINAFGKKNYLGTFAPPYAVINDFSFLATLSSRDWRAGISEAVKVALIKDRAFFDWIEARADVLVQRDQGTMEELIRRCAALHAAHIAGSGDPFELGPARPLDFGHWSAHKLEQISHYHLRHGEAVAIGIAIDCTYSYFSGRLVEAEWRRILNLLSALRLPVGAAADAETLLDGLAEFREHLGGELTIMLLDGIGRPFEAHEVDRARMIRSIEFARNAQKEESDALPVESERIAG